jgi:hypothetical protein
VTHVDCQHEGKTLTLKALPGLYNRRDAELICASRDRREAEKTAAKAAKEAEQNQEAEAETKRQEVQRHEPANKTLAAVKELVES